MYLAPIAYGDTVTSSAPYSACMSEGPNTFVRQAQLSGFAYQSHVAVTYGHVQDKGVVHHKGFRPAFKGSHSQSSPLSCPFICYSTFPTMSQSTVNTDARPDLGDSIKSTATATHFPPFSALNILYKLVYIYVRFRRAPLTTPLSVLSRYLQRLPLAYPCHGALPGLPSLTRYVLKLW